MSEILDELVKRAPYARYHIGGGEPFLNRNLLKMMVRGFEKRQLHLEYVETNASWVQSAEHANEVLTELNEIGLSGLLISASLFHAEFIPPEKTLTLIKTANRVFYGGVIVWLPDFIHELSVINPKMKCDLEGIIREKGDNYALELAIRYGVIPGARGGRYMAEYGMRQDWRSVARGGSCRYRLENTTHFHVDLEGNYVPGLCGGIVLPFNLIPGNIGLPRFPILERLVSGGVSDLTAYAMENFDFRPLETGYSGACDLCTHIRWDLYRKGNFEELGPSGFYDERSIPGFP